MIFTNDIYRFIDDSLLADDYKDIRAVPINVLEEKINEYLKMKLNENDESLDNTTLLTRLEMFLEGQHSKGQMMANFTFYLLHFMSIMQGFSITWQIEEVDTPYFKCSEFVPGKIDSLITSKDIDYISTFNFVLEEIRKLTNNESRGK